VNKLDNSVHVEAEHQHDYENYRVDVGEPERDQQAYSKVQYDEAFVLITLPLELIDDLLDV
jgi:hypothetical protein